MASSSWRAPRTGLDALRLVERVAGREQVTRVQHEPEPIVVHGVEQVRASPSVERRPPRSCRPSARPGAGSRRASRRGWPGARSRNGRARRRPPPRRPHPSGRRTRRPRARRTPRPNACRARRISPGTPGSATRCSRDSACTNSGPIAASRHSAPNACAVSRRGPDHARGFEMKTCTTSAPVSRASGIAVRSPLRRWAPTLTPRRCGRGRRRGPWCRSAAPGTRRLSRRAPARWRRPPAGRGSEPRDRRVPPHPHDVRHRELGVLRDDDRDGLARLQVGVLGWRLRDHGAHVDRSENSSCTSTTNPWDSRTATASPCCRPITFSTGTGVGPLLTTRSTGCRAARPRRPPRSDGPPARRRTAR